MQSHIEHVGLRSWLTMDGSRSTVNRIQRIAGRPATICVVAVSNRAVSVPTLRRGAVSYFLGGNLEGDRFSSY